MEVLSDLFRYTARYRGHEERTGRDRRPAERLWRDIHYLHLSNTNTHTPTRMQVKEKYSSSVAMGLI